MPRTHFALFQKYRCGTSSRAGPPCSGSSGSPSYSYATHAFPSVTSSRARLVVEPPSHHATASSPHGSVPSSSASTDTPVHVVSNFDHFVTQWMSTVTVSLGSARSCFHVQVAPWPTAPPTEKLHSAGGVCGVGPADRTGKSVV